MWSIYFYLINFLNNLYKLCKSHYTPDMSWDNQINFFKIKSVKFKNWLYFSFKKHTNFKQCSYFRFCLFTAITIKQNTLIIEHRGMVFAAKRNKSVFITGLCLFHLNNGLFHPPRYGGLFLNSKHPYCKNTSKIFFKTKKSIFYIFFVYDFSTHI